MKALCVRPGTAGSTALLEVPEPRPGADELLVEPLAVGVCGTDREIVGGRYGAAPPGRDLLVLGHECVGKVLEAPAGGEFSAGDHVVPVVRRPDPVPCGCCASGEWDMCRNGRFTERGITGEDGFASERFRLEAGFAVKVDASLGDLAVLLEPASIVAKAWEQIGKIGARACFKPRKTLVTGAGTIGLLAALMAAQRGFEVHVVDRTAAGPKPRLVRALGAAYYPEFRAAQEAFGSFDVALECTGAGSLVLDVLCAAGPNSITCLTGVSSGRRAITFDLASLNRNIVLENGVVFGTVNANLRHYEAGALALKAAERTWLAGVVTRRVPLARWEEALTPRPDDVKVVLT